jgi:glyoxylase-like metal-dependent hydrolase (beta-lactamase superfamily II)
MRVGDIDVMSVHDGVLRIQPTKVFNTTESHRARLETFVDQDGGLPVFLGGFVIRTGERVMLVDAGLGPRDQPHLGRLLTNRTNRSGLEQPDKSQFGHLLTSLDAIGLTPSDVTDVVLTHLHHDHIGWISNGQEATFPNAKYRCDQRDWDYFIGSHGNPDPRAAEFESWLVDIGAMTAADRMAPLAARLELWDSDGTIAPGVNVRSAPGHTPGSSIIVLSSGTARAMLLGDVVHCPAELLEDEWECIADVDIALARRTREALARELEGQDIPVAAAHFAELQFGRLLQAKGGRQWVVE